MAEKSTLSKYFNAETAIPAGSTVINAGLSAFNLLSEAYIALAITASCAAVTGYIWKLKVDDTSTPPSGP